MVIEIFADNLRKCDALNNKIHVSCKLIIRSNDKALVMHRELDDLYFFPSEDMKAQELESDCLKRLLTCHGLQNLFAKKTLTIKEYFPLHTYINHYYLIHLTNTDDFSSENHEISTTWFNFLELLTVFDQYDGLNPHGTEIYEREFIALVNSI